MCGHRYSSLTLSGVRIGEERRNVLLGEGRYWRDVEFVLVRQGCQEYFLEIAIFLRGLGLDLRLSFALFLGAFTRNGDSSQSLVFPLPGHHKPGSRLAFGLIPQMFPIRQRQARRPGDPRMAAVERSIANPPAGAGSRKASFPSITSAWLRPCE